MKQLNRVELEAANGSETAIRTVKVYNQVNHVSQSSRVKGTGNRPPTNDNIKGGAL